MAIVSIPIRLDQDSSKLSLICSRCAQSPLFWSAMGFLLGRSAIFGEMWPFGLAYLAVWRATGRGRRDTFPVLLSVAAGLISVIGLRLSLPYFAAFALLWAISGGSEERWRSWLICSCLLIKMPFHYILEPMPIIFVVGITECVLAVSSYGLLLFAVKRCLEKQLACVELQALLFSIVLIVSVNWHWDGFSPRLFLISILIVLGARLGGLGVSCILGPVLALLALLLGESTQLVLLIVISSLLIGFLHRYSWGYYVSPVLALVVSTAGAANAETMHWLVLLLVAVWVAKRIPDAPLKHLARIVPGTESFHKQTKGYDEHLKQVLDHRIDQYLTVFEELESTLLDVENPLFYTQMQGMAELLQTMKNAFTPDVHFTKDFEEKILNHFAREDLAHITVIKTLDGYEVHGALRHRCPNGIFCQKVADFCSGTIESQRYGVIRSNCSGGGVCGFEIAPSPKYKLEIGKAKVAQQEISGDSQVTFQIASSKVGIVLSDGMGVGLKAQTESNVVVRLLERMIKAGYDLATAVSLINRLLMLRNQDDMFATIDLVVVDLFSGQLEFVKIGSAPSFIKRGREVEIIHNHSLPVGVLSQVDVETDRRTLKEGEVLVMATDGVLDVQRSIARKDEWMCWNLRRLQDSHDMASMAEKILSDSLEISRGQIQDDMMVVVARLIRDDELETYRRTQSSAL